MGAINMRAIVRLSFLDISEDSFSNGKSSFKIHNSASPAENFKKASSSESVLLSCSISLG